MDALDSTAKIGYTLHMKHKFLLLALLLMPFQALATVRVGVIDTGFGYRGKTGAKLCSYGHKDFSKDKEYTLNLGTVDPVPTDFHGHGTNVAGIITRFAGKGDYCLVIIKYYGKKDPSEDSIDTSNAALQYALNLKLDFINYSSEGTGSNLKERNLVVQLLDSGATIVSAAGNSGIDLAMNNVYPASYDKRIIVVGALGLNGEKLFMSNYGSPVTRWEIGENVEGCKIKLTGTSQATAVATGKVLNERLRKPKAQNWDAIRQQTR